MSMFKLVEMIVNECARQALRPSSEALRLIKSRVTKSITISSAGQFSMARDKLYCGWEASLGLNKAALLPYDHQRMRAFGRTREKKGEQPSWSVNANCLTRIRKKARQEKNMSHTIRISKNNVANLLLDACTYFSLRRRGAKYSQRLRTCACCRRSSAAVNTHVPYLTYMFCMYCMYCMYAITYSKMERAGVLATAYLAMEYNINALNTTLIFEEAALSSPKVSKP
ncbi:hypothetical protein K449DRAFT_424275 [Hypoxylon sp. EC38]|nr:hypothetical protein K449DRAFT_424275 [Hypoxylon sp. EC38]